jgi:hypothetical protein
MRRIKPHRAAAPAKADNAEPIRIASLGLGPIGRRVEIGKKLMIGLAVDERHQLRRLGDLGEVAEPEIIIGRDCESAELA